MEVVIMNIKKKEYWSAIACKLIETFISVKLWILILASFFVWQLLGVFVEIKDFVFMNPEIKSIEHILSWSKKILDISLAMFTGVIITVLLSREVFKHARINLPEKKSDETNIKEEIV
jgi:hypothetical protein